MVRLFGKLAGGRRPAHSTPRPEPLQQQELQEQMPPPETDQIGLFELSSPKANDTKRDESRIDIVAIHGLNGHPHRTWTDGDCFWLQDFLPSTVPTARIFTYGYNSGLAFTGSASRVDDYARALLERLRARRREFPPDVKRPILFICHSLGGIVLKKALIIAHERSGRYSSISNNTFGAIFMGTPHRGSDAAFWSTIFTTMADLLTLGSIRTQLLEDLQPKSACLGDICFQFVERAQSLRIFTIYERLKIKGFPGLIVDEHSAIMNLPNEIPIPIEADHRSMCRFSNKNSEKYQMVLDCLKELVDDALEMEQPYDSPARAEFLQSLNRLDPEDVLRKLPRPSPGTCSWIMDNNKFQDWRDLPKYRLLWIWGIPGIGKTTSMRYLVENLRRWLQRRETTNGNESSVSFFFCDSKDRLGNSQTQLLSSLLYQILSQHRQLFRYLADSDLKEYVSGIRDDPLGSSEEGLEILWRSLFTILQRSKDVTFWMFIDAIDELTSESRNSFLRQMSQLIDQDLGFGVKLVFTDRVGPYSQRLKQASISLEMQSRGEIASDVRRFISAMIEDLCANGAIPWRYQTQIEETILELSEGNFLQASLAWANFSSGVSYWSPQVIKNRLESVRNISKEATAYYCSLLERIPEDSQDIAKMGFTWVLGSRKPLNVSELQHAVAISAGQSSWADLVESLGFNFEVQFDQAFGFLLRVEPDRHVRFAHATVKELLTSPHENLSPKYAAVLSKYRIQESDIDAELAKACIVVLSFRDFVRLRDIAQEALSNHIKDFLVSALQTDESLINLAVSKYDDSYEELPNEPELSGQIMQLQRSMSQTSLLTDNHTLFSYCVAYWNYHCSQGGSDPEMVESLSRFVLLRQSHFFHLVAMLLGMARVHRGPLWSKIDQFARLPPLHFVMRIGDYPEVVQNLICQGQDVNSIDCHGWSPLSWAVLENRKVSMEALLSQDSTILNQAGIWAESPLHLACKGEAGADTIRRLVTDPRTNINAKSSEGWTVLHWCLPRENMKTVVFDLLSRTDLDINATDGNETTYLDQVFHEGLFESVALKIISRWDVPPNWFDKSPSPNYKRIDEDRPSVSYLRMATLLQWHKVEDLILSRDPSKALLAESDERNLLEHYAFHGVQHRLSQILAKLPKNLFNSHKGKSTALLLLCAQQDWELIMQELRHRFDIKDSGVDQNGQTLEDLEVDESGRTLAHWASELQWKSISSLVLHKPTSWLDHAAKDGRTALHVAAEHRNQTACESLLKAGASYLLRDNNRRLPIHIAAEQGHRPIVQLLLACPIRDYGKDDQGRDLLHFLAMWHSDAFIRLCLAVLRPKTQLLDKYRRSPLHYAAMFGNSAAVKILLEIGTNPNLKDGLGYTPIHHALSAGSLRSVQLLLDSGADFDVLDRFSRNSPHLALRSENPELIDYVMKIIESKPEDINRKICHTDSFGQTVLHRVCLWNTMEYRFSEDSKEETIGKYIRALRALGANPNAQDHNGFTPLHIASKFGNAIAVEALLLFPETQPHITDNKGCTPLDWAVVDGQSHIASALRRSGTVHSKGWRTKLHQLYAPWQEDNEGEQHSEQAIALVTTESTPDSSKGWLANWLAF